ncbi:MAG: D-alanine--D-alanine ligase [Clostridia bacterium]
MNVLVIFGGKSTEHDISIITALQLAQNYNGCKNNLIPLYINNGFYIGEKLNDIDTFINKDFKSLKRVLFVQNGICDFKKPKKIKGIDCAILCAHGGDGENGALAGMMEMYNIPYTSCDVLASSIGMSKDASKKYFKAIGLNVLPNIVLEKERYFDDYVNLRKDIVKKMKFPLIIKPNSAGSSIGIKVVKDFNEFEEAMEVAFLYDEFVTIERALTNFYEINCAAIKVGDDIKISQTEHPASWQDFLTYEEKYISAPKHQIPADISAEMATEVSKLTEKIYKEMNLFGVVRMDFMWDRDASKLYINEINTIPGSMAYYLFEGVGIMYNELIEIMIEQAVARKAKQTKICYNYNTSVLQLNKNKSLVGGKQKA